MFDEGGLVPAITLDLDCAGLTKATEPGEDEWNENALQTVDIFFYLSESESPVFYQDSVEVDAQGKAIIYVTDEQIELMYPSGATECSVYVLANRPENVLLPEDKTIASLKSIAIDAPGFQNQLKQESFVMDGQTTATLSETNGIRSISGTVPLYRAASKITLSVNNPSSIVVEDAEGNEETWVPDPSKMQVRMNNGVIKANVDVSSAPYTVVADDYFTTGSRGFEVNETAGKYECEAPFYSYSSKWEKTDQTGASFTLVLPWSNNGGESYKNCYYQVMINAAARSFDRNHWYNMVLNVGVLGSFEDDTPIVLNPNTYIAEWGASGTDVALRDWVYLIVPDTYLEIDNKTTGTLLYESSHDIDITINSVTYQTFTSANPTTVEVTDMAGYEFSTETSGTSKLIRYTHTFDDEIFSPIVVKATVTMTVGDITFSEDIEIVQYPPIWVAPYQNSEYTDTEGDDTVFVNGYNADENGTGYAYTVNSTGDKYPLGQLPDKQDAETPNMYVITVSSLHSGNTFSYNGGSGHEYVIGDPRVRTVNNILGTGYWATAPSLYQGEDRELTYYYPTDGSDGVYNVIAPKFRIVSAYSSSGQNSVNSTTAALRCASYQEDGYPAGRWRLPTYAEVQFAVMLQSAGFIPAIFKTQTKYYFSTGDLTSISETPTITEGSTTTNQGSVRCVYDDWYWGSERACDVNTFTWGDQPR